VLASPIAGVYADRMNRRDLMIYSSLAQGVVTALVSVLYVTNALNFSLIIVLVLLLYSGAQFYRAANGAIIPSLVSKENLGAANGLFSLSTSANQLVSFSLGGIIILAVGPVAPITYDSITFFAAAGLLGLIAKSYGAARLGQGPDPGAQAQGKSFRREFLEGLSYLRKNRIFLELVVFGIVINFFVAASIALLAPYAGKWVHGNSSTYGFLLSSFSLGTILGSVAVGRIDFRHYVGRLLFSGVVLFGFVFALAGIVTEIPAALAVFFVIGLILAVVNIPITVLIQTQIPGELLGRASTVMTALFSASQPIAALLAGVFASYVSIGDVFIGSGVSTVIATSVFYLVFKELKSAKY
jgi:MFS family permease